MTTAEKIYSFYYTVLAHRDTIKAYWADCIVTAGQIAEDNPNACIILMRPYGCEYFSLDYMEKWARDKAEYYYLHDDDGCRWFLLDFAKIKGLPSDESEELTPHDAMEMIVNAYKETESEEE